MLLGAVVIFQSCVPYKKQVYFQYLEDVATETVVDYEQQRTEYKLQVDDIVDIRITSPVPEAAMFFSQTFKSSEGGGSQTMQMLGQGGDIFYLTGYIVEEGGTVSLPVIGDLPAAGKSIEEIRTYLEDELLKYFNKESYYVSVKLGGIRFSIFGEVARPGRYIVLESRYNIYQALAHVGDLGVFANRNEVYLMRQNTGKTEVITLDLLSEDLLTSEYFYLKSNDVFYIKPIRAKTLGLGATFWQNLNSAVSLLSTSLSLYIAYQIYKQGRS